jgi:hypothetical protein
LIAARQFGWIITSLVKRSGALWMLTPLLSPHILLTDRTPNGVAISAGLPRPMAAMYLAYRDWGLPPLNGITTTPLLSDDGSIRGARGYDAETGLFCEGAPDLAGQVPDRPTRDEATAALKSVRRRFRTLPFADAVMKDEDGVLAVDLDAPIGNDESGYLSQLLGAACRPYLEKAPGLAVLSPNLSGSGAGKGLAVRCIMQVAYGRQPGSIAQTTTKEELDKLVSAALIEAVFAIFLDNFNDMTLSSSVLASALSERPTKVRQFGRLQLVLLNALAFIALTGNGLILSKDIVRRFIRVELDARVEDARTASSLPIFSRILRATGPRRWSRFSLFGAGVAKPPGRLRRAGRSAVTNSGPPGCATL